MKQYEIGDKINGEYKVLNVFGGEGQSGMGVVYLVESKSYFEPFVIKTFQGTTEDQITRFKTEAEAWIEVGIHENIVQALFADLINEQLFMGHFDLWRQDGALMFRNGLLLNGGAKATSEQCEAMLFMALEACERYYPAFQFVIWAGKSAEEAIAACLIDTVGEA